MFSLPLAENCSHGHCQDSNACAQVKEVFSQQQDSSPSLPWNPFGFTSLGSEEAIEMVHTTLLENTTKEFHSGLYNPCWVQEELPTGPCVILDGQNGTTKETKPTIVKASTYKAQAVKTMSSWGVHDSSLKLSENNPDEATRVVDLLKECAKEKDLQTGSKLHAEIAQTGLIEKNVLLGTALVNMYAKCGAPEKAQDVFDKLPVQDIISWTALIAGYVQSGDGHKALDCFEKMRGEGITPDAMTFSCILKASGSIGAIDTGQEIHALMVKEHLMDTNVLVSNALMDMYIKCGVFRKAQEVFEELAIKDVVSWTTLIAACAQQGQGEEALNCFEKMQAEGFTPNRATYVCILKACGSIGASKPGQELHAQLVKEGLLEGNMKITNAVINMYGKCGLLEEAKEVCKKMAVRDVVSWNSLIGGYAQHGHGEAALQCFKKMQDEGLPLNPTTFTCVLKACGLVGALNTGQDLYAQIMKEHHLENNTVLANALIDMFAKCGQLAQAQEVFDKMPFRDVVTWNILIVGYVQLGFAEEALSFFDQMQCEGFHSNAISFSNILKACGSVGAADNGQEIHAEIVRDYILETDTILGTALVDMYAKCGMFEEAHEVFNNVLVRDVIMWNALMAGYSQLGDKKVVFHLFDKMIGESKLPNLVTITLLLNTCCHGGLLDEGQFYFELAHTGHGIRSTLEHYTCIVDLLGRVGHLDTALVVIEEMPFTMDSTIWLSLLGACGRWGQKKLGRWAFEHAEKVDNKDGATYVYMSIVSAASGRQVGVDNIEDMLCAGEISWV